MGIDFTMLPPQRIVFNERDAEALAAVIRGRHSAVRIASGEEAEAVAVVRATTDQIRAQLWMWTVIDGVRDGLVPESPSTPDTMQPAPGFVWLANQKLPCVILLLDAAQHAGDPQAVRALRQLLDNAEACQQTVVLIDAHGELPQAVRSRAVPFELSHPNNDEIKDLVVNTLKRLHREKAVEITLGGRQFTTLMKNLSGLTRRQIVAVVTDAVAEDRVLDAEDLNRTLALKRRMISADGVLDFVESPVSLDEIGGLNNLKAWLCTREKSFDSKAAEYGLCAPKGVLMLGVQGAGKSLTARAIAAAWQRPLLRLDAGSLYDRYVGESERRLRDSLRQAEAAAPCVLWIDEIEKAFASASAHSTDGGLSQRMFGTLLTWLQEREPGVFVVATANNIDALPPELLRKGRFDETFFVDLPAAEARAEIAAIHLRRRKRDPEAFDLGQIAVATDGFSGAEIEQAIISALHAAFAEGREPTTADVAAAAESSPPLSVTMAEKVHALRAWARNRCVPAD